MGFLLTGGTGFVGRHLRSALEAEPIVLLGRGRPRLRPNERWLCVDLSEPLAPESLSGGEVLCHLAYSRREETDNVAYNRHLLDAVNGCTDVKRVVLLSSVAVYGANSSPVIDEESICDPVETYARTKLACEMLWREGLRSSCGLTVLRPTEIVGIGGGGMRSLIRDALERPLVGAIKRSALYHRSLHYVAVGNVVAAITFCLRRSQAPARETFIISGDHRPENRGYAAMQDLVRRLSGRRPLPGPAMPRSLLRALGRAAGRPLGSEQVYVSDKIRDAGFRDAVSLEDEVRRLVEERTVSRERPGRGGRERARQPA
jgi:nucleoside-diphosphate-sugar epimerase